MSQEGGAEHDEIIKGHTQSLCPDCYGVVPARVLVRDGQVVMERECPAHGRVTTVIESDPAFYRVLCHDRPNPREFEHFEQRLVIPVTHRCNQECFFCYLPDRSRPDPTIDRILELASGFAGGSIELSGGEPTLREDLDEIIRRVLALGKRVHLATNGLRLADPAYVERLRQAGLRKVLLSLYSFDREAERKICGRDSLGLKLAALDNLRRAGMTPALSFILFPDINLAMLPDMVRFAARERAAFIMVRRAGRVGLHWDGPRYFFSDFAHDFARVLGWDREQVLSFRTRQSSPYFLYFSAWVDPETGQAFPANRDRTGREALRRLAKQKGPLRRLLSRLKRPWRGPIVHKLVFRVSVWPDMETIDLMETTYQSYRHLTDTETDQDFFHTVISQR